MKCHEGSSPALMKCRAASKTTKIAVPANDASAAARETPVTGPAVASAISAYLRDPGHGRLVPASRPLPPAGDGVGVLAEPPREARRGAREPAPDREGVIAYLPHVLEGDPPEGSGPLVAEEIGLQVVV